MSIDFRWPNTTNKGTALLKLLHQRLAHPLFKDEFLQWFVDDTNFANSRVVQVLGTRASTPEEEFQRIAFWYAGLRERFFDDFIQESMQSGARQLLLLGSGFDTRFLRLGVLSDPSVHTFEVDLERTISEKSAVLKQRLGGMPPNLHLLPFDFNNDDLCDLFASGLNARMPTVCVWQGVTYYLPKKTVGITLRFMSESLPRGSAIGFDFCSPLMLMENEQIPGIRHNIRQLAMKGEPYVFGMQPESMKRWLQAMGLSGVQSVDQQELEQIYSPGIGLPESMWYVVTARNG